MLDNLAGITLDDVKFLGAGNRDGLARKLNRRLGSLGNGMSLTAAKSHLLNDILGKQTCVSV